MSWSWSKLADNLDTEKVLDFAGESAKKLVNARIDKFAGKHSAVMQPEPSKYIDNFGNQITQPQAIPEPEREVGYGTVLKLPDQNYSANKLILCGGAAVVSLLILVMVIK